MRDRFSLRALHRGPIPAQTLLPPAQRASWSARRAASSKIPPRRPSRLSAPRARLATRGHPARAPCQPEFPPRANRDESESRAIRARYRIRVSASGSFRSRRNRTDRCSPRTSRSSAPSHDPLAHNIGPAPESAQSPARWAAGLSPAPSVRKISALAFGDGEHVVAAVVCEFADHFLDATGLDVGGEALQSACDFVLVGSVGETRDAAADARVEIALGPMLAAIEKKILEVGSDVVFFFALDSKSRRLEHVYGYESLVRCGRFFLHHPREIFVQPAMPHLLGRAVEDHETRMRL